MIFQMKLDSVLSVCHLRYDKFDFAIQKPPCSLRLCAASPSAESGLRPESSKFTAARLGTRIADGQHALDIQRVDAVFRLLVGAELDFRF